jgi:cyclase
MPLATRVIPSILCRGRQQVKGKQFHSWRSVGLAAQAVRVHQARGVDEVVLLDVGATPEGRGPDLALVEELAEVMFAPLAVGGGIKTLEDVRALLRAGADKVVIGTAAHDCGDRCNLVAKCAEIVGSQAVVAAIDVKGDRVVKRCGTEVTVWKPSGFARLMEGMGAGEILLTSIDREGTMNGYDIDLIRVVSHSVSIPVIAHGGCRGYGDMADAIHAGASAVAAGALFQFTDARPRQAAEALAGYGIEVRL